MKRFLFILLTALVLVGCGEKEPVLTCTVTFDSNGGTPTPQPQTVISGDNAVAPADPARQGYVFLFWHLHNASTAYNFQTPVQKDITLLAKWQEEATVEYWPVLWELNGGTWPSDDNHAVQVAKGGTINKPNPPVKQGSNFEGWYLETALTNKVTFPYVVMGDIKLYAKWKNEGGSTNPSTLQMFTSISAMKSWLLSQSNNDATSAYKVGLKDVNLDSGNNWGDLGIAVSESNRYIDLDLSGCTSTSIPDGYEKMDNWGKTIFYGVFVECYELVAIKLPPAIKTIGKNAFFDCGLTTIEPPYGLETIGERAFYDCGNLVSVILPETVKSIHYRAFYLCSSMKTINLPEGLQTIGVDAFSICMSLSVVIPESITTISKGAFSGSLVSITLPKSLRSIEDQAFSNSKLTYILIPENVKTIGQQAFRYSASLSEVIVQPATPPTTTRSAIFGSTHSSLQIKVPPASLEAYKTAYGWDSHADKIVANTD